MSENNEPIFSVLNGKTSAFIADSSYGAAAGTYCIAGTFAGANYYSSDNGFMIFYDDVAYVWTMLETDTPDNSLPLGENFWMNNGMGPDSTPPLTEWYNNASYINPVPLTEGVC